MSKSLTVRTPAIGSTDPVSILAIFVQVGDHVELDDALVELETEKATLVVRSESVGTVESLLVSVGDNVEAGEPILVLRLPHDD